MTTTSSDWQRWRTTVGSTTAGLSGPKYRLSSAPTPSGALTTAFTGGNRGGWTVRGDATQPVVRAVRPGGLDLLHLSARARTADVRRRRRQQRA